MSAGRRAPNQKTATAAKQTNKQKNQSPAKKLQKVASGRVEKPKILDKLENSRLNILQHIANQALIPHQVKVDGPKAPYVKETSNKRKQFQELFKNCPKASDPNANKCDIATLTEAIYKLNVRKVKLRNDKWLLNDMKTGEKAGPV